VVLWSMDEMYVLFKLFFWDSPSFLFLDTNERSLLTLILLALIRSLLTLMRSVLTLMRSVLKRDTNEVSFDTNEVSFDTNSVTFDTN
jgi:hypothetical protein